MPARRRSPWSAAVCGHPPETNFQFSAISPDGRFLTYSGWATGNDLFVHDLATGRTRLGYGTAGDHYVSGSAFSRDARQVAFGWSDRGDRAELRVAALDGTGLLQSRLLFANDDIRSLVPFAWSPDGNWIAVGVQRKDRTMQIGLVSARDGSLRTLKSSEWRSPRELFFSPDGRYLGFDLPVADPPNAQRDVFALAVDGRGEAVVAANNGDDTMMGWSPDGRYLLFASDPAAASLSFDERLGMLVDAEQLARDNRALRRRLREATLTLAHACLEDLDYSGRKLDRALIRQLATCRWVAEHHNVLITGPTGVGKRPRDLKRTNAFAH